MPRRRIRTANKILSARLRVTPTVGLPGIPRGTGPGSACRPRVRGPPRQECPFDLVVSDVRRGGYGQFLIRAGGNQCNAWLGDQADIPGHHRQDFVEHETTPTEIKGLTILLDLCGLSLTDTVPIIDNSAVSRVRSTDNNCGYRWRISVRWRSSSRENRA